MGYQRPGKAISSNSLSNQLLSPHGHGHMVQREALANYSMPRAPNTSQTLASRTTWSKFQLTYSANNSSNSSQRPCQASTDHLQQRDRCTSEQCPGSYRHADSESIDSALWKCLAVLNDAVTHHSKHPFTARLLAPDGSTVLLTQYSISHIQHAESELARLASLQHSIKHLNQCTLVATWGAVRHVFRDGILVRHRPGKEENLTMHLPCRTVLNAGQRKIEVIGPVPHSEDKIIQTSKKWWDERRSFSSCPIISHSSLFKLGRDFSGSSVGESLATVIHTDCTADAVDDAEYQADLKVDWMS